MTKTELISFKNEHKLSREELDYTELEELYLLIKEVKAQGFQRSADLSYYIRKNQLGFKYPNISGEITMQSAGDRWKFKGGFPSNIYRIVCSILGLSNNGSHARVVGFKSYSSMGY